MRCFQCQRFGHTKNSCRGKLTCARCSLVGHESESCSAVPLCINCKGEHTAFSRSCPKWKLEKEVQATKVNNNISYAEARRLVQTNQIRPNTSFAAAVKSTKSVAVQVSVGTQTLPIKTQETNSKKKNEKPTHSIQNKETVVESKPKNKTQHRNDKNRSHSNSSYERIISESGDSDSMEVEEGLEIPKHLLPFKTKRQHRKNKHQS
ncbi:Nucleic-acid-binding protein from mobile element jockey, partial [Stegodyphus mimosarum]